MSADENRKNHPSEAHAAAGEMVKMIEAIPQCLKCLRENW